MTPIPLRDLEAEIHVCHMSDDYQCHMLWMDCPVCGDHQVAIPFGPESVSIKGVKVWKKVSGATVDDLTLSPSFRVVDNGRGCQLHGFVRAGHWENCSDSHRIPVERSR